MNIATKRLMADVLLFRDRVNLVSNSLPEKSPYVIALNTLVESNKDLLQALFPIEGMAKHKDKAFLRHPDIEAIRHLKPDDSKVAVVSDPLKAVWDVIVAALPEWKTVLDGFSKPGEMRKEYIFAFGIGWQALAKAAAALIKHRPNNWERELAACIKAVDWTKGNKEWHGVAMIGERVNNTGPGVKATAGYILKKGGFNKGQGITIDDLLNVLEKSAQTEKVVTDANIESATNGIQAADSQAQPM